jgi:hypothetical protein
VGVIQALIDELGADRILSAEFAAGRATSYWDQSPRKALALLRPRSTEERTRSRSSQSAD